MVLFIIGSKTHSFVGHHVGIGIILLLPQLLFIIHFNLSSLRPASSRQHGIAMDNVRPMSSSSSTCCVLSSRRRCRRLLSSDRSSFQVMHLRPQPTNHPLAHFTKKVAVRIWYEHHFHNYSKILPRTKIFVFIQPVPECRRILPKFAEPEFYHEK